MRGFFLYGYFEVGRLASSYCPLGGNLAHPSLSESISFMAFFGEVIRSQDGSQAKRDLQRGQVMWKKIKQIK
jgi:hypothetical protein